MPARKPPRSDLGRTVPQPMKLYAVRGKKRRFIGNAYTLDAATEAVGEDDFPLGIPLLIESDGTEMFWDADRGEWRVRHDESTALEDELPAHIVPCVVLERIYRAAFIIDERGEGNEMVDEILNTLTPYVSEEARDRIETEVHADPESGCEGG